MGELLSHEHSAAAERGKFELNLMSTLVRATEQSKESVESGEHTSLAGLSDEQIFGNMFAFNLAGHETTANTITLSLVLLAANPQYQNWLAQETDEILEQSADYESCFPRLKQCIAVIVPPRSIFQRIWPSDS